jgi:hypothetical protein
MIKLSLRYMYYITPTFRSNASVLDSFVVVAIRLVWYHIHK